jgi:hypothetical protein
VNNVEVVLLNIGRIKDVTLLFAGGNELQGQFGIAPQQPLLHPVYVVLHASLPGGYHRLLQDLSHESVRNP